jgi:lactate dehydrogenase-like 2-hydroxyacid dehydrogenase
MIDFRWRHETRARDTNLRNLRPAAGALGGLGTGSIGQPARDWLRSRGLRVCR